MRVLWSATRQGKSEDSQLLHNKGRGMRVTFLGFVAGFGREGLQFLWLAWRKRNSSCCPGGGRGAEDHRETWLWGSSNGLQFQVLCMSKNHTLGCHFLSVNSRNSRISNSKILWQSYFVGLLVFPFIYLIPSCFKPLLNISYLLNWKSAQGNFSETPSAPLTLKNVSCKFLLIAVLGHFSLTKFGF